MKETTLARMLQQHRLYKVDGLYKPKRRSNLPRCEECSRNKSRQRGYPCDQSVEGIAIEDMGPDPDFPSWFIVRAVCHGKEEVARVTNRGRLHPDHWSTVLSTGVFFQDHVDRGHSHGGLPPEPGQGKIILP